MQTLRGSVVGAVSLLAILGGGGARGAAAEIDVVASIKPVHSLVDSVMEGVGEPMGHRPLAQRDRRRPVAVGVLDPQQKPEPGSRAARVVDHDRGVRGDKLLEAPRLMSRA